MSSWIRIIFLLILAVLLAVVLREHSGNVLIIAQPWRIELSLTLAVLLLIALFIVLHVLLQWISWLSSSPTRFRSWRGQRAQRKDRSSLEQGWIGVLEGRDQEAEQKLARLLARTRSSDTKVLAALALARSQHDNGRHAQRDETLEQARVAAAPQPKLQEAVAVVRAELLLDQQRADEALALLQPVYDANPKAFNALRLLLQAHWQLGNQAQVYECVRLLQRKGVLSAQEARPYIERAVTERLAQVDEAGFKSTWGDLKKEERLWPSIALGAAAFHERLAQPRDAAKILEAALNQELDPQLLSAYSQCPPDDVARRVAKAETWLKQSPNNADLLTALGNLCLKGQLWGAGERYLQRSMALRNDVRIHALLGTLYDRLGRSHEAMSHWRLAALAAGTLPVLHWDSVLPAADMRSDPGAPDALPDDAPRMSAPAQSWSAPEAASAVGYLPEESSYEEDVPRKPTSGSPLVDTSDDDLYFDSAPIPGIDLSQTSDRSDSATSAAGTSQDDISRTA
ncbi:tetratricopeptide repeat protein [Pusillimonas sp. CC-YST705]|uniref:Tetratricopeptide repeat protein n=1 Tax=Mesopusillimonas faecipullorum TaxID=2755040 RepID=A0ABS8CBD7_9BURK|nr:heme biosynthesis HemY N-terminal domain-containing protein [Mesopusillimonas faecipullorum]MCB5363335.1 tetratricopeptide repeat protein [Mesopusillimonas faecipullorum]